MSCATAPAPDELAALRARVAEQAAEISHLKLVIAKLRRMQFGRSSEKMDQMLGQLELSLEELETRRAERGEAPVAETPEAERHPRAACGPLPEHLPRETVEHLPAQCDCPTCGGKVAKLGETVSEVLESGASLHRSAKPSARRALALHCFSYANGSTPRSTSCRRNRPWPRQSAMRSLAGRRSCDTRPTGASRSTTTPRSACCARLPWARKNFLFAGSDAGGGHLQPDRERQAQWARSGGLSAPCDRVSRVAELLPWNIDLTPTSAQLEAA